MRRLFALLASIVLTVSAAGCTPRPNSAEPVAEAFLKALEAREDFTAGVDNPAEAQRSTTTTWEGLQAEGLTTQLKDVSQTDNIATATYEMSWQLPRERTYTYDANMTLTQVADEWTVRWQPSILHPRLGANQHLELRAIPAHQASVVSSDGVELLRPGVAYRVLVDPSAMRSAPETAQRIAEALAAAHEGDRSIALIDAASLTPALASAESTYSVTVIPATSKDAFEAALGNAPGVRLNEEAAMVNQDPTFAPDIMARIGALVGDDLDGEPGWSVSVVNENGAEFEQVERVEPDPSPAVSVSLDHAVQRAAEQALEPVAGQEAMIVAIRPSTGGILAVAQTPAADRKGNLATMGQYPPGSTFKIITSAAGLQRQGLTPDSTVPCPGTMNIYGRIVTNYAGFGLGSVPLQTAFARSCNTTFADISTKLAPGELRDVGKQFGLGVDFSIPGIDTVTGDIPVGDTPLERTEAGYGQGYDLASPFGMALVSATAAHGSMPVPFLVAGEETKVGEQVDPPSPESIDELRRLMKAVVMPGGTAGGLGSFGDVYGKTGEAEITGGSHAWFTGYRADDDIAFATLVVLGGGSEAAVALTSSMLSNLDAARG
ncbi:penicillin-binding transpeptidase domain-containing protein [Corynebacterium sp. Q4381]|uniref:penicillin-binding transpeptidase domain-containing protein n=1 Tax=Corynebacterium sp. Marseille-Q4381 TaxID=3121597 RepID=UPI002FE5F200